ncbi:hypothetical protein HMPREF2738_01677 [Clostridiales bacterium KLE1615]|nr:hypothetical protein HMPREF2738_01677 [Clostridiales bacterium KLE1615]
MLHVSLIHKKELLSALKRSHENIYLFCCAKKYRTTNTGTQRMQYCCVAKNKDILI